MQDQFRMALGAIQSLLDLKVVLEGTSHHQTIQQTLQLLQEGFKAGCTSERQRKKIAKAKDKDGDKGSKKGSKGI